MISYDFRKKLILLIGDCLLIVSAVYIAFAIRTYRANVVGVYTGATVFMVLSQLITFYIFDLYNLDFRFRSASYLARLFCAVLVGMGLVSTVFYFFPRWKFGRSIVLLTMLIIIFFCYVWRYFFKQLFLVANKQKVFAIVGAGIDGEAIYDVLCKKEFGIRGFFDNNAGRLNKQVGSHTAIGDCESLENLVKEKKIDAIVMTKLYDSNSEIIRTLMDAKIQGVEIYEMTSLYEELMGKLPVFHLSNVWMTYTPFYGMKKDLFTIRVKYLLDFCLASLGLVIALPIAVMTMIIIVIDSKGSPFFRQQRIGCKNRVFSMVKFRSMRVGSESNGAVWAKKEDARTTRVGRFIRKTRIDEIPQLWNILKGDMSFIGPRPERPEFVSMFKDEIPFYSFRHMIKPGITGWAQVNFRYGASKEDAFEKLQYDLYYVKNLSILLDLYILFKTIRVVLFGTGAR